MLATFDGPAARDRLHIDIRDAVRNLDLEIRCGLHTGEVEIVSDEVRGIAVHIAGHGRMALAGAGEVLVSGSIPPLVLGSGMTFDDHGSHVLKGVPDPWPMYAVVDPAVADTNAMIVSRHLIVFAAQRHSGGHGGVI